MKTQEEKRLEQKKQRDIIREFDRMMSSYQSNGLPPSWNAGVWGILEVIMMIVPWQAVQKQGELHGIIWIVALWSINAPLYYMMPYQQFRENGKSVSLYKKIKYLPVDIRQVKIVRVEYLLAFLKKTFIAAMIVQLISTLLFYHTLSIWNIVYVLILGGFLPFVITVSSIWCNA